MQAPDIVYSAVSLLRNRLSKPEKGWQKGGKTARLGKKLKINVDAGFFSNGHWAIGVARP